MHSLPLIAAAAMVLMVLFISGCDERPPPSSSGDGRDAELQQFAPLAWQGNTITIHDEQIEAALEAAMAEARETADAARLRFNETPANDRQKWLIKWEVPIDNAGDTAANEYLWVRPVRWSQFRIEGYLATQPQQETSQGNPGSPGDLVSFPISELADWVYLLDGTMAGARQGGYTIDILEDHFGTPEPGDDT